MNRATAKQFFDEIDDDNFDDQVAQAKRQALRIHTETVEDVSYTLYTFGDASTLRLGSNGFIGCEVPE